MRFHLTLVALALLLISCEGNTRLEWSLENQSSDDLIVVHDSWDYSALPPDTVLILSGETYLLGSNDVLGGNANAYAPASFIDTLFIYSATGNLCTKNWGDTENWKIESEELSKVPSSWRHTYVLTVDDYDF
jgi:hypothetical protein